MEILTGATLDCRPHPVRTSPTLRWSEIAVKLAVKGDGWVALSQDVLCYFVHRNVKTSFSNVVNEITKHLKNVLVGIGI
jgi:hypothetical protein